MSDCSVETTSSGEVGLNSRMHQSLASRSLGSLRRSYRLISVWAFSWGVLNIDSNFTGDGFQNVRTSDILGVAHGDGLDFLPAMNRISSAATGVGVAAALIAEMSVESSNHSEDEH